MPRPYNTGTADWAVRNWYKWNSIYTTTAATTTGTWNNWNQSAYTIKQEWLLGNGAAWRTWNNNSITFSNTTNAIWYDWVDTYTADQTYRQVAPLVARYRDQVGAGYLRPQRTEEEWAEIQRENERLRAERDKVQAAARAEARKLLELVLSKEQLASYDKDRFFDVVGSHGTLYRIRHGVSGNISQIVNGREVSVLCVHPSLYDAENKGYLPTEDNLVAQVLALKTNELEVVQTANVHRGVRHLAVVRDGESRAA